MQPSRTARLRRPVRVADRATGRGGNDADPELTAAESRLLAETLANVGDALIRKALNTQPGSGRVFDELMSAGQDLLQRGNDLDP
jgi:hypothetical protein